jgi:dolichol-phosphate mannosyltransferase
MVASARGSTEVAGEMSTIERPDLSVISPCYNEEEVIRLFYEELLKVLDTLGGIDTEIIFIDDGSTDATLSIINDMALADPRVRVCSFSRNFGHQIALTAGLDYAMGDAVIMMDCDLQHPPSVIPNLVEKWRAGSDIVSAIRLDTKGTSLFKKLSSRGFYFIMNKLSTVHIPSGAADFCLISRRVCGVLTSMPEHHRFLRGMISWVGFNRSAVTYQAEERAAGRSKYTLTKMVAMALDAALSFSTMPIRLATRVGFAIAFIGVIYLAWSLINAFWFSSPVPGWASVFGITMLLGGAQLLFIGIVGQYLARVFEESKGRPIYVMKQEPIESSAISQAEKAPLATDVISPRLTEQSADEQSPR